ncbi:hypothetical protein WJX72_008999 [[Myrmecia] bisecta]|uniref:Ndc10 domain-containing protein n=1 Tax=[Myrmecia] bisecta TaxID=41462 RepID=A0AAW1R8M1_9CHLO
MALSDSEDSQEVAQPSRKRKKQSSARLQRHEMQEFIDEHKASKRSKTNSQYASHDKKFKWFLEHHYGGETEEEPGTVRKEPYSEDLTLEYGLDLAVRYISWVGKNMPGFEYRNKAATLKLKTFEGVHSALQSMYTQQLMSKHARSTQHVTAWPRHDGRLVHLADLCPPTPVACIGPAPCVLLSAVLRGGKTQENGKVAYLGCIRTRNPLLCPVGALGRHLCQRFTIDKEPFPDVLDKEAWNKTALWTGSNPFSNLTYQQQSASLRKYFTESDIFIKKLTHAFRVLGARFMDMAGVDDSVIGRTGKWMYQAMYKSYLMFFKPEGLLGVGEWPGAAQKDFTQFWRPEFLLEVPDDLIYVVFPHLRRLEEVVKELGRKAGNSVKAAPHVYRYLATVVIQDALGGMADKRGRQQ